MVQPPAPRGTTTVPKTREPKWLRKSKTQIRTYVKVEESKQLKMEIQIGSEFTDTSTVAYYYNYFITFR